MNNQIKAVIFDLDGVLIEAKDWHYDALNRALNLFGLTISRYDHLITFDGLPTVTKLDMLTKENGLPKELHNFINELKQKYTMELIYTNCKPRFHHEYALSRLKADGYKIGCASNSIRDSIEVMLKKSSLDVYMDIIFSAQDVDNPKPASDIYDQSIVKLGLKPENCLIVEDNQNGIMAAKASGGHLLVVDDVKEVNIKNIYNKIHEINNREENK
jgi:beta-phosphoglucomutase